MSPPGAFQTMEQALDSEVLRREGNTVSLCLVSLLHILAIF